MNRLSSVREAFKIEIRDTKHLATLKARRVTRKLFEDLKALFKAEYNHIVEAFNKLRYQLGKNEKQLLYT